MSIGALIEALKAFRGGAPLGDVALMKFAAMKDTDPSIAAQLDSVAGYAPPVHVERLLELPNHTLGHAYASFLRKHALEHFNISPHLLERYKNNPYAVRYTVTHDLHHVLTGFDAGMAGEQGVMGFTVGQNIAPTGRVGLWLGRMMARLVSPTQAAQSAHNYALGVRMGRAAKLLIATPLESWFERPLADVRAELGIDMRDIAAVQPSETSWLADVLYGRRHVAAASAVEPDA